MANSPAYEFREFKRACRGKGKVVVQKQAQTDADRDFNLKDVHEVRAFISNNGLEELTLINSEPWENNPDPDVMILVDAYRFKTGRTPGYFAFFHVPATNTWVIKSMKHDRDAAFALKEALLKAGFGSAPIIKREEGEHEEKK